MKQAWNRLGSPDAISWIMVVLLLVQLASGSLVAPFTDLNGRIFEFLAVRISSLLVISAVLGLGKMLLLQFARKRPMPLLTLGIFAVATVAGSVTQNWLLIVTQFTDQWTIGQRLIVAIPGLFAFLLVSGILISLARELARDNQELAATAFELITIRAEASVRIEQRKAELVSTVREQLEQSWTKMKTIVHTDISAELNHMVDDVIRPLSFQISNEVNTFQPRSIVVANPRVSWRDLVINAMTTNPAHPFSAATWLALLVGTFLIPTLGLRGLVTATALAAITFLGLTVVRLLWSILPQRLPVSARASCFAVITIGLMATCPPAMEALSSYEFAAATVFVGWIVLGSSLVWTVTLVLSVRNTLRSTRETLLATVDELKREVIQLNGEMRRLQKGISRLLHGPVQQIVSAAIHRLRNGNDGPATDSLVADLQARIAASIQLLNNPREVSIDLDNAIRDFVELWDGVVEISLDFPVETLSRLHQEPVAMSAIVELIREECGNAVRHGEATHIYVKVSIDESDKTSRLIVKNDGKPLPISPRPGMGSQILDDLCLNWLRTNSGELVKLEALLPLAR